LPVSVGPDDGEIGDGDVEHVIVVIGNTTFVQTASVRFAPGAHHAR
jgi:hypothetical protein